MYLGHVIDMQEGRGILLNTFKIHTTVLPPITLSPPGSLWNGMRPSCMVVNPFAIIVPRFSTDLQTWGLLRAVPPPGRPTVMPVGGDFHNMVREAMVSE